MMKLSAPPKEENPSPKDQQPIPSISLPKGGGAIRGMGEKFAANPVTGTGSMSVPIATSPGRAGFGPQLSLSYDSGSGNGSFGFGWSLSLPSITRKTDKGLPRYLDAEESDVFILSGAEDLVPVLSQNAQGQWVPEVVQLRTVDHKTYGIQRYRPRIEGLFARIERWINQTDPADCFWRSISKDNITTWYGRTANSRIADPADPARIFSWLICESHDDKGNVIVYNYKEENSEDVDLAQANERNRTRTANRYLKWIRYGNHAPYQPKLLEAQPWPTPPGATAPDGSADWFFEVVLDYDEHDKDAPKPSATATWARRPDPFSSYRAGFEVRTYRLCQRVLMFHHFPSEEGVGADCLVRSTDFTYSYEEKPADAPNPIYSFLRSVTQTGYKRNGANSYFAKSLPPLEFKYTQPIVQDTVQDVEPASLENLPIGLDGAAYQWTDLHGEGIPGILTEQAGAWFYKRNLSPYPRNDCEVEFAPLELVASKPNLSLAGAHAQFMDLAGDGQPDLVVMDGPMPGLYEHNAEESWQPFRPFTSRLNRDMRDPNLKFIDLDGDGHADVLITEDEAFVWHASLAEDGFGPAYRVAQALDEEKGPRLVFADVTQSIYLADLSGDGLTDLVRIRNGEVCYWPNLGYGRFGAKVTMDNAPWFDHPDQFNHKRIRLADIDGSGTTDIIYLHRDGVRLYFNQSGNSWGEPHQLNVFPRVDDLVSIIPTDLLGNGTACLVWSSPLPGDAMWPMRYVDLMGGTKPHLLVKTVNNLGAETHVQYAPSTKFYLQDKNAGKPWITRLPFPVHVVEKVIVIDKWRNTSFSTTYSYHHGYFDGIEREFRGFGRVEQIDVETFGEFAKGNANSLYISDDKTLYQPPVKTVTWFHTGALLDRERILRLYQEEYFPNWLDEAGYAIDPDYSFAERPLPEPDLANLDLGPEEWRDALRACKGMTLRQEVYELDVDALEAGRHLPVKLFTAACHNCHIQRLQPRDGSRHTVFLVTESEALTYHYELELREQTLRPDPRIAHSLILATNQYGQPLQTVAVGYPRVRPFQDADPTPTFPAGLQDLVRDVQNELHLAYTETRYTDDFGDRIEDREKAKDNYRLRLPCEVMTFELTGIRPADEGDLATTDQWDDIYFTLDELRTFRMSEEYQQAGTPVRTLQYHELPDHATPQKRLVEQVRTLYFSDNLVDPLDFGVLNHLGLPYETYKLALTEEILTTVLGDKLTPPVQAALADSRTSGYLSGAVLEQRFAPEPASNFTGQYWIRSGIAGFADDAAAHFYLPERYTDPFGNTTILQFDVPYDFYIRSSTDPLGNTTEVTRFDFRVLAPGEIKDINNNVTEVWFDILGLVVASAVKGKQINGSWQGDNLIGYSDELANPPTGSAVDFCTATRVNEAQAREWLGNAGARFIYHFGERIDENGNIVWNDRMAGACGIVRERHVGQLGAGENSRLQVALECSDGTGNVLMKKVQAEPDPVTGQARWIVNGLTVLNNKGKPVKQYEPKFSPDFGCELPQANGVATTMFYDAPGRLIRTELPDGSYSRVAFSPWFAAAYDPNDTVLEPGNDWYTRNSAVGATPEAQRAARLTAVHADTPGVTHFDSLGREVVAVAYNRYLDNEGTTVAERYVTFTRLDAEGKPLWIRDSRGNRVMQYITPPIPADQSEDPAGGCTPCYDIAGNLLFQHSMDAGDRWILNDITGKPLYGWDSRNNVLRTTYDSLRRPVNLELRNDAHSEWIVVGLTQYGEGVPAAEDRNLRGKTFRAFDQSGMLTNVCFDFKGNPLEMRRRLASDYKDDTNWQTVATLLSDPEPESLLMPETFTQVIEYDALNRLIRQYNWHKGPSSRVAVYEPQYSERGLLQSEVLVINAIKTETGYENGTRTPAIKRLTYNEKGQRLSIEYGNNTTTTSAYDKKTFRLIRLQTTRSTDNKVLQNLHYTYDPSGNITEINDNAQPRKFFNNFQIDARNLYTYDALYRLIEAQGREHAGQLQYNCDNWNDCSFRRKYGPNQSLAWRNYTQRYCYDSVGNILTVQHLAHDDTANNWTRQYQYAKASNRLLATGMGAAPVEHYVDAPTLDFSYDYNVHGSMTRMPHLDTMDWDFTEHLRHIARTTKSLGEEGAECPDASVEAWYRYDAAKERNRKRVKKKGGLIEERFYLGGFEIFRRSNGLGTVLLERETLHLMDDKQCIALIDIKTIDDQSPIPDPKPQIRYQLSNHLGSASLELDEAGEIISYEEYHPYGTTSYQAVRGDVEVSQKRYRYTGKERDEETGLNYHGARYFAPWLERWTSCDPIVVGDGVNIYQYVKANPFHYVDRSGFQTETPGGRNPVLNRQVGVKEGESGLIARLKAVGQQVKEGGRVIKSGIGGSVIDIQTKYRSLESKVMDIATRSYRNKLGELKESHVARVVRRAVRQAAKHEKALKEAGIELKETVVLTVKGAKDEAEHIKVLKIARETTKKVGGGIKVGALRGGATRAGQRGSIGLGLMGGIASSGLAAFTGLLSYKELKQNIKEHDYGSALASGSGVVASGTTILAAASAVVTGVPTSSVGFGTTVGGMGVARGVAAAPLVVGAFAGGAALGVGIEHAYPGYTKHTADIGIRVKRATGSDFLGIGATIGTTLPFIWAATKAYDIATGK